MSTRQASTGSPLIGSKSDLVQWIATGEKPRADWRIGTEHEKHLFHTKTLAPVPYDGATGIRVLMSELVNRYGWEPVLEGDTVIALSRAEALGGGTVSLEPGGQFELSGHVVRNLHEVWHETHEHIEQVRAIGADLNIGMLGLGFTPTYRLSEMPRMPKRRYAVMTNYMPKVGTRGLDMMYRTATIQVNLDFSSEADMAQKLRVSLALQPIAQALFAASPFTEGRPNGFQTARGHVWLDTDNRRTGNLPFAFQPGMSYERYVDYALDVPMYFVFRDGQYIDVAGASFRDFMSGKLVRDHTDPRLAGEQATIDDWSDHLTTLFPDVRMKRFLEMRGADGGPLARIAALPAFWVGLLYDQTALDAAWDLVKDWTDAERDDLRATVPRAGLTAPFRSGTVLDVARAALAIAQVGLSRRAVTAADGADETRYLAPLQEITRSGQSVADHLLARYHGAWGQNIERIFVDDAM